MKTSIFTGFGVLPKVTKAQMSTKTLQYWQFGPDDHPTDGEKKRVPAPEMAAIAAPVTTTDITVDSTLDTSKPVDLSGTVTLKPPPSKFDELFQKGAYRIITIITTYP